MSSGSRVSIPSSARKTIQNIKEIAGNHSDEEIYAMLKECSMDPNETAQKLLLQDTFHEVKRKRDRRKENLNNREPTDSRWRPGMQGRGSRGGRGNYSSRYISHDAGGGRNVSVGKENWVNQGTDRGIMPTSVTEDTEDSSVTGMMNGPTKPAQVGPQGSASRVPGGNGITYLEESSAADSIKTGSTAPLAGDVKSSTASLIGVSHGQAGPRSDQFLSSTIPASVSSIYASASDPVLVPFLDSRVHGVVGTIKREVGSQRIADEPTINKIVSRDAAEPELSSSISERTASEIGNSYACGKLPNKSQGFDVNQLSEAAQAVSSSSYTDTSGSRPSSNYGSRPSSNYGSRSQQLIGPQKVAPVKEWKPKPTNPNPAQASGTGTPDVAPTPVEAIPQPQPQPQPQPALSSQVSDETTTKLQKKLEGLQFSDGQHVIIPNHIQVPEAERTGLSFGSFDANFRVSTNFVNGPDSEESSTLLSESSQGLDENIEEPSCSIQNAFPIAQEEEYTDHPQSPTQMPENLASGDANVPSSISAALEYDQSKPEAALAPGGSHYSVHTAPTYSSFGLMPPMHGSQFAPFESSESQARDGSRLPNFVVQQPFDPSTSYYTPIYRPSADGDGRFSPFLAPGSTTKFSGNVAVLSAQTGQSPQESGNSIVSPTAGPTPLGTQATGVMQSSIAVTQQPVPVFRQPAGVHLSHYPPNYIPYSQYFSPFYVSPPTIHHFLSNTAFPQQPPTGTIYPPPVAAASTPVKYSLSQYKPVTNSGNSVHVGMPTAYGPYGSSPTGYSPNPSVTTGSSTGNEDLTASQYKENNVYITGQQSEGSAVWIPAPARDIPGMQASSFYNLPPQGQHVTFAPTQAGHGAFTGIYHPTQTVAAATVHPLLQPSQTMAGSVEMVGPPAGVYQQPQRAQMNWANNY